MGLACIFLILLGIILVWSIRKDFDSKYSEFILAHWPKGVDANNYVVNINSINLETKIVNCSLICEPPIIPKWDIKKQILYGPLAYSDLTHPYVFLPSDTMNLKIAMIREYPLPPESFSKSPPLPINFTVQALGSPEFYPFDRYFIMGAIACQSYLKKGKGREYLHIKKHGESLSITNSAKGLFIRYPTKSELDEIKRMSLFSLPPTTDEELNELNNRKNRFALIMQRPLYLQIMTIILGSIALLSALYVGFKTPFKEIPIHVTGLIIALWGIRNILLGDFKIFPSYFDYTSLGIYLVLFGGITFRKIKGGEPAK